ncbi:MAG TPA: pyruvate dehydrogenase (acetyl-transferring) E1 component subunit alpha [Actinomycetota bacterium]|nr:pyruvate dehydrogenase (acetyl-transferring) E1 component subunit alpha [Actinomycetota bacterium]
MESSQPLCVVSPDGTFDDKAASGLDLKEADLLEIYRLMSLVRRADLESTALQRQGELAVYPPLLGQEAAQVGSAYALASGDFVFPSYRELGAAIVRGIDMVEYLNFYRGTWHGGTWDFNEDRFGMVSVPIASQIPHAVGYALGSKLEGKSQVTLVYFGDGATSQGDFHEGANLAAVFKAPVVLFCQNNQWAISVPVAAQTAAPIHTKAQGYGMPGVLVDGNDVLATYLVTKHAIDRARSGEGPTLIEALTYRMGPHSTADDASKYQPKEQIEKWGALDPLQRYRTYLEKAGILTAPFEEQTRRDADELAAYIRQGIVGAPPPALEDLFKWVFAEPTPHLSAQSAEMLSEAQGQDG